MNNRKRGFIVGIVGLFFIIVASLVLANSETVVGMFTKEKNVASDKTNDEEMIVKSKDVTISLKEFFEYRENLAFIHQVNQNPFEIKSADIIDLMVGEELLLMEAKENNLHVTDDEIMAYALQTKEAMEGNTDAVLNDLLNELAKELHVKVDDYFTHPDVLEKYERLLLTEKLVGKLYEENVLNETYTLDDYTQELVAKHNKMMNIDYEMPMEE